MRGTRFIAGVACALLVGGPAAAQVPDFIHQEGLLYSNGQPLDGPVTLTFALYAGEAGGAPLWAERHDNLALMEGYYSAVLGSRSPLTLQILARARWMGVQLGAQPELAPRIQLASVPFSLVARSVSGGPVVATSVHIGDVPVIDDRGRWVGDPAGLQGPVGPRGEVGPQGQPGPAGSVSPDGRTATPETPLPSRRWRRARWRSGGTCRTPASRLTAGRLCPSARWRRTSSRPRA